MSTDPRDTGDVAWLDAREAGAPVLPPIDADRAEAYDRLQELITALPDQAAPDGWQADVMAALPDEPRIGGIRPRRRRWNPVAAAVAAVAVAAAGLVLWLQRPAAPVRDGLGEPPSVRIVSATGGRRGDASGEAAIGDVLQVEVAEGTGGELRIYREDREVVLRCPGRDGCKQRSGRVTAELRLTSPGRYRAVYLLLAPAPDVSSPLTGTLEGDLSACRCASRTAVPIVAR